MFPLPRPPFLNPLFAFLSLSVSFTFPSCVPLMCLPKHKNSQPRQQQNTSTNPGWKAWNLTRPFFPFWIHEPDSLWLTSLLTVLLAGVILHLALAHWYHDRNPYWKSLDALWFVSKAAPLPSSLYLSFETDFPASYLWAFRLHVSSLNSFLPFPFTRASISISPSR